jgi:parallel beta-helix repeat protein
MAPGRARLMLALALAVVLGMVAVSAASARTIEVRPTGPNALQRGLNRAEDGDRIRVHPGTYSPVIVGKRVEIFGIKGPRPTVDGNCNTLRTIDIASNGVTLRHLEVTGAAEGFGAYPSEVNFIGIRTGRAIDLRMPNTCDAEYGVNVFDSGRIVVAHNRASGFSDAGIYIGGINDTSAGTLEVRDNVAVHNNRGIIIEDSSGVDIDVLDNVVAENRKPGEGERDGIFIRDSDRILIRGNEAIDNGKYGIAIDNVSDRNRLFDNTASGSGRSDFIDLGSANCGARNSFPIDPC